VPERAKGEDNAVFPGFQRNGTEQQIGLTDRHRFAVYRHLPTGIAGVCQE
jgi:hypothetical protein